MCLPVLRYRGGKIGAEYLFKRFSDHHLRVGKAVFKSRIVPHYLAVFRSDHDRHLKLIESL